MVRLCALLSLLLFVTRSMGVNVSFPFIYRDGLLWVDVSVAGQPEPLHFLLDSGANVSVIDSSVAKNLGLPLGRPVKVRGVQSAVDGFWPQQLTGNVGSIPLPSELLATDLAALGRACGTKLDGLLGGDFFRDRILQIDFAQQCVRVLEKIPTSAQAHKLPLKVRRDVLLVSARVNCQKADWFRIDTGCSSPLQWVDRKAAARLRPNNLPSVGLTAVSIPEMDTTLQMGRLHYSGVATGVHPKGIFPEEAGLIGNGILTRFARVTFAPAAGFLILE